LTLEFPMSNNLLFDELKTEARRLLRYRYLLAIALIINCVIVARVPLAEMQSKAADATEEASDHGTADVASQMNDDGVTGCVNDGVAAEAATAIEEPASSPAATPTPPAGEDQSASRLVGFILTPPSRYVAPASMMASNEDEILRDSSSTFASRVPTPNANRRNSASAEPLLVNRSKDPAAKLELDRAATAGQWVAQQFFAAVSSEDAKELDWTEAASTTAEVREEGSKGDVTPLVVLTNPADNGGPVRFLLNGEANSLAAGQTSEFSAIFSPLIQFHRGGSYGNAEQLLDAGHYQFAVTSRGWELMSVSPSQ
jgi:hypothetical protein